MLSLMSSLIKNPASVHRLERAGWMGQKMVRTHSQNAHGETPPSPLWNDPARKIGSRIGVLLAGISCVKAGQEKAEKYQRDKDWQNYSNDYKKVLANQSASFSREAIPYPELKDHTQYSLNKEDYMTHQIPPVMAATEAALNAITTVPLAYVSFGAIGYIVALAAPILGPPCVLIGGTTAVYSVVQNKTHKEKL